MNAGNAEVSGFISYESGSIDYSGEFSLGFIYESEFWNINKVVFPNFGNA